MKILITVLTEDRYVSPKENNDYTRNVLLEDQLVMDALKEKGYLVNRKSWSDKDYDWSNSDALIFRTTWDYFERFQEFKIWLEKVNSHCQLFNNYQTLLWNRDKIYLRDLENNNVRIPNTVFIPKGSNKKLKDYLTQINTQEYILKPNISGAAMDTHRLDKANATEDEDLYLNLVAKQDMMLQDFQSNILTKGEISLIFFGLQYSHAVIKNGVKGDFRVQDDFGGTVRDYEPSASEIRFAKKALSAAPNIPAYARLDLMWDNDNKLCLSELELIEPELWFRKSEKAAGLLAYEISSRL